MEDFILVEDFIFVNDLKLVCFFFPSSHPVKPSSTAKKPVALRWGEQALRAWQRVMPPPAAKSALASWEKKHHGEKTKLRERKWMSSGGILTIAFLHLFQTHGEKMAASLCLSSQLC